MYHITIFFIGKTKEAWLLAAIAEYTKRLQPAATISWVGAKDDEQLKKNLHQQPYFCLDPKGTLFSSEQFSTFLHKTLLENGSRLNLVIGGPEGLTPVLRKGAAGLISLSPLTFTHQISRLILLEQLYRAIQIEKGTPYHK